MERFNYLHQAAMALPSLTESQKVLKSLYMTRAKKFTVIDKKARDLKYSSCSRCNILWSDGSCSFRIKRKPKVKCKNKRKYRLLVAKYYCYGMKTGRFAKLSRFLAKKLCKQVTFTCGLCCHEEIFYMKQKSRTKIESKKTPAENEDTATLNKKRKNKKKSQFAGLNANVMTTLKEHKIKDPPKTVKKQKKPNKKATNGKKPAMTTIAKGISKNRMLELAQLLKNKDKGTSVNKLELMFK